MEFGRFKHKSDTDVAGKVPKKRTKGFLSTKNSKNNELENERTLQSDHTIMDSFASFINDHKKGDIMNGETASVGEAVDPVDKVPPTASKHVVDEVYTRRDTPKRRGRQMKTFRETPDGPTIINRLNEIVTVYDVNKNLRLLTPEDVEGDWVKPMPIPKQYLRAKDEVKWDNFIVCREIATALSEHFALSLVYREQSSKHMSMRTVRGRKRPFDIHPSMVWTSLKFTRFPASASRLQQTEQLLNLPEGPENGDDSRMPDAYDHLKPLVTHTNGLLQFNPSIRVKEGEEEMFELALDDITSDLEDMHHATKAFIWGATMSCSRFDTINGFSVAIDRIAQLSHLKVLNLANMGLDDSHAPLISACINDLPALNTLVLTANHFRHGGMRSILQAFLPGKNTWGNKETLRNKEHNKLLVGYINEIRISPPLISAPRSTNLEDIAPDRRNALWDQQLLLTLKISENPLGHHMERALKEAVEALPKNAKLILEAVSCQLPATLISSLMTRGWENLVSIDLRNNNSTFTDSLANYFSDTGYTINRTLLSFRPGYILNREEMNEDPSQEKGRTSPRHPKVLRSFQSFTKTGTKKTKTKLTDAETEPSFFGYNDGQLNLIFPLLCMTVNLRHLDLSGIPLRTNGLNYLSQFLLGNTPSKVDPVGELRLPGLSVLTLRRCGITTITESFIQAIRAQKLLRHLDLSHNPKLQILAPDDEGREVSSPREPSSSSARNGRKRRSTNPKRTSEDAWHCLLLHSDDSPTSLVSLRLDGCSSLSDRDIASIYEALVLQRHWILKRWSVAKYKSAHFSKRADLYSGLDMNNKYHKVVPPSNKLNVISRYTMFLALMCQRKCEGQDEEMYQLLPRDSRIYEMDRDMSEFNLGLPRSAWVKKGDHHQGMHHGEDPVRGNLNEEEEFEIDRCPVEQLIASLRWYRLPGSEDMMYWKMLQNNFKTKPTCHGLINRKNAGPKEMEHFLSHSWETDPNSHTGRYMVPYIDYFDRNHQDPAVRFKTKYEYSIRAEQRPNGLGLQSLHLSGIDMSEEFLIQMTKHLRNPSGWFNGLAVDDKALELRSLQKVFMRMPAPPLVFTNVDWYRPRDSFLIG